MKNRQLNILVIGTGMYVCGRGTETYGTVLPAIYAWKKKERLGEVCIAGAHLDGIKEIKKRNKELGDKMNLEISPHFFPKNTNYSPEAYKEAINRIPKPACAIIVVPDHLHRKMAGDCLESGLHTLVVKPLTTTVKEAKELIRIQKKHQLYGAVEFHKRFDRANLKLKEILTQGKIGDLLYFIVEFSQRKSIPSQVFAPWLNTTNIFQYLGVHYIDIIYFVTRAIPKRVMAIGQDGWLKKHGLQTYDAVHATVEWERSDGHRFFSYLFTNWIDSESTSAMSDQKIKVIGTKGRFESDQKMRGIYIITDEKGIEEPNPDFCTTYPAKNGAVSYQGYGIESIHTFLRDVTDIIQNRVTIEMLEAIRPTFKDCLPATAVVEAVNKSLDNKGVWVEIDNYK